MKRLLYRLVLIGSSLGLTSALASGADSLTLAYQGRTAYTIAIAVDATSAEITAAHELALYLGQVTGADFAIRSETDGPAEGAKMLVGAGARVKQLLPQENWAGLGADGIVIKTVGRDLILAGGQPRGALYAVYSFLEDQVGVRWWTPTESTVPRKPILQLPPLDVAYAPPFFYREHYTTELTSDPVFAARMRENGPSQREDDAHGGHYSILGSVHTFDRLLPPGKYFKEHPEWYSDVSRGGKPSTTDLPMPAPQGWQLCLTNEEARAELTRNALEWISKNPDAGMIAIDQNDNDNRCASPADLALEEREGSPSGPLLEFVNAVAADIEKQYPNFQIVTLAYRYTRKPPRFLRPRQNVIIRLCSIEADFSRPLDSPSNAAFARDMAGWKTIAPRLFVWDYVTNFYNSIWPHPNLRVLGPNLKYFAGNGVAGVFEQGDMSSNNTGDLVPLRAWVTAHLLWNPYRDQGALVDEFLRGYYGAAAPYLSSYLDVVASAFALTQKPLSTFQADDSYLTLGVVNSATRLFRSAEAAVATDPILAARVRQSRLALDNVWVSRYSLYKRHAHRSNSTFEGPADPKQFAADFVAAMRAQRVEYRSELQPFEFMQSGCCNATNLRLRPDKLAGAAKIGSDVDPIDVKTGNFGLYREQLKGDRWTFYRADLSAVSSAIGVEFAAQFFDRIF